MWKLLHNELIPPELVYEGGLMDPISSNNSVNNIYPAGQAQSNNSKSQAESTKPQNTEQPSVIIELSKGKDNVEQGSKSQNTLEVNVKTPNKEVQLEVSRSQAVDLVERRITKNAINAYTGNNNDSKTSPVKAAAIKSNNIDSSDLEELATLKNKKKQADYFMAANQTTNTNYGSSSSSNMYSNSNTNQPQNMLSEVNQAMKAYTKQTLFFSTVDRLKGNGAG